MKPRPHRAVPVARCSRVLKHHHLPCTCPRRREEAAGWNIADARVVGQGGLQVRSQLCVLLTPLMRVLAKWASACRSLS